MAEDTSETSIADRERRRGSLARRALERVRNVMNRRRNAEAATTRPAASSSEEPRNVAAVRMAEPAMITTVGAERNDIPGDIIEEEQPIRAVGTSTIPLATRNMIEVDMSDDDDTEEPLLPMRIGRAGLSTEKARSLFAQHGFMYEPRCFRPQQEPPNKIRRIEKPIRMRVHYTCHECHRQFGVDRTCLHCGHQRCRDCSRDPPRRVRELSDQSRRSMQQQEEEGRVNSVADSPTRTSVEAPTVEPEVSARPAPEILAGPLELDESAEYTTEALPRDYELSAYTRPRVGIQTVWSASSRPRARKHPHNASNTTHEDEAPMVQSVKRVYRKPRQRVRYTCENCSTLFIAGDRCHQCGHERCQNCHREPPKRTPPQHDPEVMQAVAARFAAYAYGQPSGVTAAVG